jgi:predicted ATP-dependent endonuclease of OLD family
MKLQQIEIQNFKSIENVKIEIKQNIDTTFTFGLIGENEAGKSSILKAIGIIDNLNEIEIKRIDFLDKEKSIIIIFDYELENKEQEELISSVISLNPESKIESFNKIRLQFEINIDNLTNVQESLIIKTPKKSYNIALNPNTELTTYIKEKRHRTVFWSFDDKYLISKEIDLPSFFRNPDAISIPLKNCFKLADFNDDLSNINTLLIDSTEREEIREKLSDAVTKHLKRVWKKHKVKITFDITPTTLNFHIKDEETKNKAKTIEQRSDGFRQFISFLLTISAENTNSDFKNTILLLDEPETHLHPKAQEDLLQEFIEITKKDNNILFFATHSNYLIDKNNIERNAKILKIEDKTTIEWFKKQKSTYASVNYEVFGIASSDFHNEMYDYLRDKYSEEENISDLGINRFDEEFLKQNKKLKKDKPNKDIENSVTLPTYVRNCIHYPSNKSKRFDDYLVQSIEMLKNYVSEYDNLI